MLIIVLCVIVFGVIMGIIIGYRLRMATEIIADHTQQTITLKGGFFTLYIFIVIFAVHSQSRARKEAITVSGRLLTRAAQKMYYIFE